MHATDLLGAQANEPLLNTVLDKKAVKSDSATPFNEEFERALNKRSDSSDRSERAALTSAETQDKRNTHHDATREVSSSAERSVPSAKDKQSQSVDATSGHESSDEKEYASSDSSSQHSQVGESNAQGANEAATEAVGVESQPLITAEVVPGIEALQIKVTGINETSPLAQNQVGVGLADSANLSQLPIVNRGIHGTHLNHQLVDIDAAGPPLGPHEGLDVLAGKTGEAAQLQGLVLGRGLASQGLAGQGLAGQVLDRQVLDGQSIAGQAGQPAQVMVGQLAAATELARKAQGSAVDPNLSLSQLASGTDLNQSTKSALSDSLQTLGGLAGPSGESSVAQVSDSLATSTAGLQSASTHPSSLSASQIQNARFNVNIQFGRAGWFEGVANRVAQMAAQNLSFAEIQLDPPELGPLQVRVQVNSDQATVVFNAQSSQVKDALEQNSQKLREMFEAEGLNLVDVDVGEQNPNEQDELDSEQAGENMQALGESTDEETRSADHVVTETSLELGVDDFA